MLTQVGEGEVVVVSECVKQVFWSSVMTGGRSDRPLEASHGFTSLLTIQNMGL
jgi:hypothetical protein